jgi:vacuolar-type H+-ATPase subunit I/STV1
MDVQLDVDPALFGVWPKVLVYDGLTPGGRNEALEAQAWAAVLDTKSDKASPLEDLQDMLNGMTKELRMQLQQFQVLREQAGELALADADEIDRKQTQADAKASIEAMSLIVRTLEKIDSLQRTIAHDRQLAAESEIDEDDYEALCRQFEERIETRAQELSATRQREAAAAQEHADAAAAATNTADATGPPP